MEIKSVIVASLLKSGFNALANIVSEKKSLDAKFKIAMSNANKSLSVKYDDSFGGYMEYFSNNNDVQNEMLKYFFSTGKITKSNLSSSFDFSTLPETFLRDYIKCIRKEIQKDIDLIDIFTNKQIHFILIESHKNLKELNKLTTLTLSEITKINEQLRFIRLGNLDIERFQRDYRSNVLNNFSQVNFIGLGVDSAVRKSKKKLQDVYVKPQFLVKQSEKESIRQRQGKNGKQRNGWSAFGESFYNLEYKMLFSISKNIVVLGNPGSGKSFLVKYIICSLLERKDIEYSNYDIYDRIPLRIELRKYFAAKKNNPLSVVEYLVQILRSEYQIHYIESNNVDLLLKEGKLILFFDGLDEIFNVSDKIEIKKDIENISKTYDVVSIVTSRFVGYDEADLDSEVFREIHLQDFDKERQEEYVNRWYKQEEGNESIRIREVNEFLTKSASLDEELKSNPLLLSLIVILFRSNSKLPESKLEIYQSCARTLIDKWEESKELHFSMDETILKRKETILADLAYWQYELLSGNEPNKITNEKAAICITGSIQKKCNVSGWDEAAPLAESFLQYAEKRSIYFDNNFTHKTFLEYYTAFWIYSNCDKKQRSDKRDEIIARYIENSYWHIVLELLLNMIDKDQPDSEIIDNLIINHSKSNKFAAQFFLSILNSLQNISSNAIKQLVVISIQYCIEQPNKHLKNNYTLEPTDKSRIYDGICTVLLNNKYTSIVVDACKEVYLARNNETSLILHQLYLEIFTPYRIRTSLGSDLLDWMDKEELQQVMLKNPSLFLLFKYNLAYNNNFPTSKKVDDLSYLISNFGLESVTRNSIQPFSKTRYTEFLFYVVREVIESQNEQLLSEVLSELDSFGMNGRSLAQYLAAIRTRYMRNYNFFEKIINVINNAKDTNVVLYAILIGARHIAVDKNNIFDKYKELNFIENIKRIDFRQIFETVYQSPYEEKTLNMAIEKLLKS